MASVIPHADVWVIADNFRTVESKTVAAVQPDDEPREFHDVWTGERWVAQTAMALMFDSEQAAREYLAANAARM